MSTFALYVCLFLVLPFTSLFWNHCCIPTSLFFLCRGSGYTLVFLWLVCFRQLSTNLLHLYRKPNKACHLLFIKKCEKSSIPIRPALSPVAEVRTEQGLSCGCTQCCILCRTWLPAYLCVCVCVCIRTEPHSFISFIPQHPPHLSLCVSEMQSFLMA